MAASRSGTATPGPSHRSLEGPASAIDPEKLAAHEADEEFCQAWIDLLRDFCEQRDVLGATWHFLYVGERPG